MSRPEVYKTYVSCILTTISLPIFYHIVRSSILLHSHHATEHESMDRHRQERVR